MGVSYSHINQEAPPPSHKHHRGLWGEGESTPPPHPYWWVYQSCDYKLQTQKLSMTIQPQGKGSLQENYKLNKASNVRIPSTLLYTS